MSKRMKWLCYGLSFLTLGLTWVPAMASSPNVQIVGNPQPFGFLQLAYDAATPEAVIQAQGLTFIEDLTLDKTSTDVTIEGGFDPTFTTQNSYTILQGTLTVALGSLAADQLILTSGPTLVSIDVTPASPDPSIAVGVTQQFTAMGTYSDSSAKDLTALVSWSSSSTSVATIATGGLATAVAAGLTTITATTGSIADFTTLTVTQNLAQLILGTWILDASQSSDPYLGCTGTLSVCSNFTFESIIYLNGVLYSDDSGTYSILTDTFKTTITASNRPSHIGDINFQSVSFSNNNDTLTLITLPGSSSGGAGNRAVYNRTSLTCP
jgi:hypothetical protein